MRETIFKKFYYLNTNFEMNICVYVALIFHTPNIDLVIAYYFITSHIYSDMTPTQYDPVHIELGHLAPSAVCPLQLSVAAGTLPPHLPGPPPQAHHHLPAPRAGGARGALQGKVLRPRSCVPAP